jgi:transposase
MGRTAKKYQGVFTKRDARTGERALAKTSLAREQERLPALRLLAEGYAVEQMAAVLGLSRPTVDRIADRYLTKRLVESVVDQPRRGRPRTAPAIDGERLREVLEKSPLALGYRHNVWTVPLITMHFRERYGVEVSEMTLRRRRQTMGWRFQRPQYFSSEKDPNRAQKKGRLSAG